MCGNFQAGRFFEMVVVDSGQLAGLTPGVAEARGATHDELQPLSSG